MSVIGTLSQMFNNTNAAVQGAETARRGYWDNINQYLGGINQAYNTAMNARTGDYWLSDPARMNDFNALQYAAQSQILKDIADGKNNPQVQGANILALLQSLGLGNTLGGGVNVPGTGANAGLNNNVLNAIRDVVRMELQAVKQNQFDQQYNVPFNGVGR